MSSLPEEVLSSLEGLDLDDLRQVSRHLPCGRFRLSRRKKPTVAARVAAQILSIDTWRSLPESDRKQLEALLPKSASAVDDPEEAFLSGGAFAPFNIFFGTPLSRFHKALEAGDFSAAANKAAEDEEALRLQDMTQHRREHHNGMVHRLYYLKRTCVPPFPRFLACRAPRARAAVEVSNSCTPRSRVAWCAARRRVASACRSAGHASVSAEGGGRPPSPYRPSPLLELRWLPEAAWPASPLLAEGQGTPCRHRARLPRELARWGATRSLRPDLRSRSCARADPCVQLAPLSLRGHH